MAGIARSLPRPRLAKRLDWQKLPRRLLIVSLLLVVLAAAYFFWLRHSSLVAVESVSITGAEQSSSVESALRSAALGQSSLAVDLEALEAAVAGEPSVRSLSAAGDFPSGMQITVDLREPAGYLAGAGAVVAGDGVVLERTGGAPDGVPSIEVKGGDPVSGGEVTGEALQVARVLGPAPAPLLAEVEAASIDPDFGVVVSLASGPELRFGEVGQADLKWRGAAAILASPGFGGAAYLDLSVPDRPVAGGVPERAVDAAPEGTEAGAETVPAVPPAETSTGLE